MAYWLAVRRRPVASSSLRHRNEAVAEVSQSLGGLTEEEAGRRLAAEGPNELPSAKKRGPFAIALEVIKEPMFLLPVSYTHLTLPTSDLV